MVASRPGETEPALRCSEIGPALAVQSAGGNPSTMNMRKTTYALEIYQLSRPYRSMDSLQNLTKLHSYESATDFGAFHAGDTFSDSHPTKYLGTIQHVHHWLGEGEGPDLLHRTVLYVFNEG